MKVVFMGTPDFSVGTLKALINSKHEVVLAVTQPDKPRGRGNEVSFSPVKEVAVEAGIEVFQPQKIKAPESVEYLKTIEADVFVVVAFGQILSKEILDMPKYGCVNVHASLLPKYRGAAPIQWAVLNGDKVSGVTTMMMDEGLDTGDMILKKEIALAEKETAGSLFDRLMDVGADLLLETLDALESGNYTLTKQDDAVATKTTIIRKDMGKISWDSSAVEIERLIRAMSPWPSAFCKLNGKMLKIWEAEAIATEKIEEIYGSEILAKYKSNEPGSVIIINKKEFGVVTKDGFLVVQSLQLEGKRRMISEEFLRGHAIEEGTKLL